ncbi:MAG: NADH-ubiquinone oxidoreductase-F iron-sulfur binding region domain-containing protein, partial [Lapillicoccus sp.]
IVNACDGELGAAKDAWVVEHHLDELRRGADLVSQRGTTWAAHRGSLTAQRLADNGLTVLEVPDRYVSSEESALVSLAHGGLARPLSKATPISFGSNDARGRKLRPTLVLNAETVWRIAQIDQGGVDWFRSYGTPDEPGPRLVAVSGGVRQPGVVETAAGVSLGDLIAAAGGVSGRPLGVGLSGLGGGWLTVDEARSAVWSRAGLAAYGLTPGPGIVHVLDDAACPLVHVADTVAYAAGESAGQCGPCMFGVPAVADDLLLLADGSADAAAHARLRGRLGLLPGRGACRFPDGVAGYAASALRAFAPEVRAHLQGRCTFEGRTRRVH